MVVLVIPLRLALAAGSLLAAFSGGWAVNGWRLQSAHEAERLQAAQDASETLRLAKASRDALAGRLRASDDLHAAELQKAQDETNRLRDRVSAGPVRLFVAAKCPATGTVPEAAHAPGVDPGARAELDSAARSTYFALRDGIDRAQAKLAACQAELTEITEPTRAELRELQ